MKFIHWFFFFILYFNPIFCQKIELNWSFLHPVKNQWIEAGTHWSVQQSLIQSGELPDPFYGLNEHKFGWIEDHKWEFISKFQLTKEQINSANLELEFPGIDTYASIYLNDSLILKSENNFKPYRSQIKKNVKPGINVLRVIFTPPILYHADRYKNEKFHYPATNDVGKIAIASYCRKPQFQFGWDWALRMTTIGFLKPVTIHFYSTNRIIGKNCTTVELNPTNAKLDFQVFFTSPIKESVTWKSKLFGDVIIKPTHSNQISRSDILESPLLWWPRGQGAQNLYTDTWKIIDDKGTTIDSLTIRFGVRKSELIIEPDQWGTSYIIKMNGRSIFCKGGDYIPQDIFQTRVKEQDIKKMVDLMVESNFNMVRVWGGGYYPDDIFFDACDEKGIMVWQDLMFACAMYPGDSSFLENVKGEFEYQIPRIASHPSLTLFNGNNEVDVAWKNWGFQLKYNLYGNDAKQIETDYENLFKKLAPEVISQFTNSPYVHTSPLSNWGKEEYYNHGTMHYWGVWHGKDPIEDFGKKSGRFNAEYGFQSFPEFSTLATFSTKKEWDLDSNVMKHHQKSYVGNGMILKQATILYGKPKTFEEFIYFSQLTQSKAVSIAVSSHRISMPRCMGTLYWQLNDCWQAPTWSSIDYFGNWKALQYSIKKDYGDVTIVSKIEELGKEEYYLVSDYPDSFLCNLTYDIFDFKGKLQKSTTLELNIHQGSVEKICPECLTVEEREKGFYVNFKWNTSDKKIHNRSFTHTSKKHIKALRADFKVIYENLNTIEKTLDLIIENSNFLQDFWVSSEKIGVHFSENFVDLLPGKHIIKISYTADTFNLDELNYFWR